jgi:hypothetical protein
VVAQHTKAYEVCPPTSPSETVVEFRFSAPGHIATASVTRHLAAKQSHVFQKVDGKVLVDEEICEK